jgi:hypothetical protein
MSTLKDTKLTVGLVIMVISGIVSLAGLLFDIEAILTRDTIFGLTWLEITLILSVIGYWMVIIRLIKLYGSYP